MFKTKPLVICAVILITIFGAKNSTGSPYENLNTVGDWELETDKGSNTNPLDLKFVFVKFPNSYAGSPEDTMITDIVDSLLANVEELFHYQSNGSFEVNCTIIPVPGDTTASLMWTADSLSGDYNSPTTCPTNFIDCWAEADTCNPAPSPYSYDAELPAEILSKIQQAYDSEFGDGNWESPISGSDGVVFIFIPGEMPDGSNGSPVVGGNAGSASTPVRMCDVLNGIFQGEPPLESIGPSSEKRLCGVVANWWAWNDLGGAITAVVHEWGHKLGLHHPPGSGSSSNPYLLCNFGAYSIMRAGIMGNGQKEREFTHWAKMRLGWVDTVEITNSVRNIELKDVREENTIFAVPIRGNDTTFTLPYGSFPEIEWRVREYFLVAYQTGDYPWYGASDFGVFIWHVVEKEYEYLDDYYFNGCLQRFEGEIVRFSDPMPEILDLEIATGLYSDPSDYPGYWNIPNPISGVDTMDDWNDEDTGVRRTGYYNYPGSGNDLFNLGEAEEFSFRAGNSNPTTAGYQWPPVLPFTIWNRTFPQNAPNSILIKIKETTGNGVVLDILLAPEENILTPSGGEIIAVGEEFEITWEKEYTIDQPDGIIDFVDIYFNPGPGQSDVLIDTGVEATDGQYTWIPTAADIFSEGKIKIIYNNINDSSHVGEDESDGTFEIIPAPIATFSDVSSQTGLSFTGNPYSSIPLDFDGDGIKDLFVSISDDVSVLNKGQSVSPTGVPLFSSYSGEFSDQALAYRGVSYSDFDNDGDEDLFLSHRVKSKLFRYDSPNYVDVTDSLGIGILADNSTCASWGDFDRDGWLDLYVVRAITFSDSLVLADPPITTNGGPHHRLFRNNVGSGGGFVDVTLSAGLDGVAIKGSLSASWVDFDQDGDQDLFVANNQLIPGGQYGINSLLFVNQDDGTFLEQYDAIIGAQLPLVTAACWVDIDNDNDFDLLMSGDNYAPIIFFNDGAAGFLSQTPLRIDSNEGHSGLTLFDHDLDGRNDVLLLSNDDQASCRFFSNQEVSGSLVFVENTTNVGLTDIGRVLGSVATDFTNDGDSDLFLGKPLSGGKYFFKTETAAGSDPLGRNYVKVLLSSPYFANNRSGIGAVVTVTGGSLIQTQMVDGGSGRGSQNDRELTFGLGAYASTVTATVRWPGGNVQNNVPLVVSNQTSETVNTIMDDTAPIVSAASAISVFNPSTGKMDWTFSWETDVSCDPSLDKLTFDQSGISNPCWPGWTTVTPTTAGVDHSYNAKPGGGYTHEFKLYNIDCIAKCSFRYYMTSGAGTALNSCSPITKGIKICPTGP